MTHIVIHDDDSNVTHYAEFDDVQAAAGYLEDLVNRDGGSNARLFALEPVEFAVKSYVRVEIPGAAPAAGTISTRNNNAAAPLRRIAPPPSRRAAARCRPATGRAGAFCLPQCRETGPDRLSPGDKAAYPRGISWAGGDL